MPEYIREFATEIDGVTWRYTGRLRFVEREKTFFSGGAVMQKILQMQLWRPVHENTAAEYLWIDVPVDEE